jgi:hypothetical protein
MATSTQYNPNANLNAVLLDAGLSKTVYALVTPETERAKLAALGYAEQDDQDRFMNQFREAWTGKQNAYHEAFFDEWHKWSSPLVDLDRSLFPFTYPTAGASEPLRQIIFDFAAHGGKTVHVFTGEYEGYKAMGEAAGIRVVEHSRDNWRKTLPDRSLVSRVKSWFSRKPWSADNLICVSQPSAIDGNVWREFNDFVAAMPDNSVIADVTYVGAVPYLMIPRFNLNAPSIRNVVFSLSKPFGAYYDRIGGVFSRTSDAGLFGNMWFKSLTALSIGRELMKRYDVFALPHRYREEQQIMCQNASEALKIKLTPSEVYMLATGVPEGDGELNQYLTRAGRLRVCLTPGMSKMIGTAK